MMSTLVYYEFMLLQMDAKAHKNYKDSSENISYYVENLHKI